MRHCLTFACALSLLAATGCQLGSAVEIGQDIEVTTLPPGDSAGRHEVTVVAKAPGTYTTYMGALMEKASEACAGRYSVDNGSYGPDVTSPVPAGEKLRMVVSCNHDRLPNHRVVAADDQTVLSLSAPDGSRAMSAYQALYQHNGSEILAVESLLGGFLHKAYTEECAGKPVLVQFIATATTPGTPSPGLPDAKAMQATMHYQCVDAPAVAGS